jgi:site-specific DNA recombinase
MIFQVAVSKKESDIRILNEPLETPSKVPSVFLVETGEALALSSQKTLELVEKRGAFHVRFF